MIEVKQEPERGWVFTLLERCCFCRKPSNTWYEPNDVAVCRECATRADPDDVPTKNEWFRRETIATGRRERRPR